MDTSAQWELVTKKKAKTVEKKVDQAPKLEDIMPSLQYQKLLNSKVVKKSPKLVRARTPPKKQNPKQQEVKKPKQQQQQQVLSKPKSLEAALRKLTPEEFESTLAQLKLAYPGSELLWLKGVAAYLNSVLPFDCDAVFYGKSVHYPSNLAPQQFKNNVVYFLETVGAENLSYFYHTLLVNMATEMSKNMHIIGYKFLLQLIGRNWPEFCANNLAKTAILRNSYQNRSNICLTILWAISQGGYRNLEEGIKVWQNLLLPCLELKSYSKFVIEYMELILISAADQNLDMNQAEFFITYSALRRNYSGLMQGLQDSLMRSAEIFLQKYIDCSSKHANLFLTLLSDVEGAQHGIELEGCIRCLVRSSDECCKIWKMNYKKRLPQSTLLINKIEKELVGGSAELLANSKAFQRFLEESRLMNLELSLTKRYESELLEMDVCLQTLQEKSAAQQKRSKQVGTAGEKKKCGCCKWVLGSILLLVLIGGVIAYDTQVNGKSVFERSTIGKALKQAGLLPYVEKAWYTSMSASARAYKWAEQHVPPYAKPAGHLACDLWKLMRNTVCNAVGVLCDFVNRKLPLAAKYLEQYVPGLPKKIENTSVAAKNVAAEVYGKTWAFIRAQVLVGRLSPENLSKAMNQTHQTALEYLNLFHKKVDAYAKLK